MVRMDWTLHTAELREANRPTYHSSLTTLTLPSIHFVFVIIVSGTWGRICGMKCWLSVNVPLWNFSTPTIFFSRPESYWTKIPRSQGEYFTSMAWLLTKCKIINVFIIFPVFKNSLFSAKTLRPLPSLSLSRFWIDPKPRRFIVNPSRSLPPPRPAHLRSVSRRILPVERSSVPVFVLLIYWLAFFEWRWFTSVLTHFFSLAVSATSTDSSVLRSMLVDEKKSTKSKFLTVITDKT